MNTLNAGQSFDELPETYVIFITRDDVLKGGLPIYHIERKIRESGVNFGDESHIIYVNSGIQDDTELGRLMHDFHCKDAKELKSRILAERVYELKELQGGVDSMCKEMEMIYNEGAMKGIEKGMKQGIAKGIVKGIAEGKMEKARDTALKLSDRGMTISDVASILEVSEKQVEEWLSEAVSLV